MTTELDAAIERWNNTAGFDGVDDADCIDDLYALASAHIAHLEAEAERKRERAEPIGFHSLVNSGFTKLDDGVWLHYGVQPKLLLTFTDNGDFAQLSSGDYDESGKESRVEVTSMGQVLDLLAALRGEA